MRRFRGAGGTILRYATLLLTIHAAVPAAGVFAQTPRQVDGGIVVPPETGTEMPQPDNPNPAGPLIALVLGFAVPGAGHVYAGNVGGGLFYFLCCLSNWACWGLFALLTVNPLALCLGLLFHGALSLLSARGALRQALWQREMSRSYWIRAPFSDSPRLGW